MNDENEVKTHSFGQLYRHERKPESTIISNNLFKEGSLMIIGGAPKTYKSFILLAIAASLTLGRNLFNTYRSPHGRPEKMFVIDKPRKVLMFEQEIGEDDLEDRIVPWYERLSIDEQVLFRQNFMSHSLDRDLRFDKAEGAAKLERIIRAASPDIVIFDPLIEFHEADENSATQMNAVMRNFQQICKRTKVSPILSHHEGKEGDSPRIGGDRLRGSSALYGKADTLINLKINNRNAMRIEVEFTLRRGRPIQNLMLKLDPDTLECNFLCWAGDKNWKKYQTGVDDISVLSDMKASGREQ